MRNRMRLFFLLPFAAFALPSCSKEKAPVIPFNPYLNDTVSYSVTVQPLITQHCSECHNSSTAEAGYNFSSHQNISDAAQDMLDAMYGQNGKTPMPFGTDPLPDSSRLQFQAWIVQGKQNN